MDHIPTMAAVMTPFLFYVDISDNLLDPDLGLPPKDELFVRDVYLPDPYVVDDRSPLDDVLEHMATHHLGSALVTKHGRLAGIFTSTDACRAYCEHLRRIFPNPVGYSRCVVMFRNARSGHRKPHGCLCRGEHCTPADSSGCRIHISVRRKPSRGRSMRADVC